jgi:LmbE family N-acetylglucosaminyl deacetylase
MMWAASRGLFAVTFVAAGVIASPQAIAAWRQSRQADVSVRQLSSEEAAARPVLAGSTTGSTGTFESICGAGSRNTARSVGAVGSGGAVGGSAGARTLTVVAHQDDDLLFINPAVGDDIAAGRCVVTVFVTAGDAGRSASYWREREAGAMAAYAGMASVAGRWTEDTVVAGRHRFTRRVLAGAGIALLFLRLPDGHGNATRPGESLQRLWRGQIPAIHPLDSKGTYTRDSLTGTLTALMNDFQPDDIRTLDHEGVYGDGDHADHHTVGYFTYQAQRAYRSPHRLTGYLGYPVEHQPANLPIPVRDQKLAWFMAYAPFDPQVCQTAEVCLTNFYEPRFARSVPVGSEVVAP